MRSRTRSARRTGPSLGRVAEATWGSLKPTTRRKLIISGAVAAVLSGVDAAAVGLLPTLVHRFQGRGGGLFDGTPTSVLGGLVVGLLIAKSIGGAVLIYWQSTFIAHDESERTVGLFGHLFGLPYSETSRINTGEFVRDLHVSLPMLYRGSAAGIGLLVADGLGLLGLVTVVIITAPFVGLVLSAFLVVAAWLYAALIRPRVSRLAVRLHDGNRDCLNDLNESFGGLKTLKAFATERFAVDRFSRTRNEFALAARDQLFFQQISRYYLEIALVIGLGACIGATYAVDGRGAVLATFGLLSGVAARAMPSLARCLYSLTSIKIAGASVLALEPHLRQIEDTEELPPSPVPVREGGNGSTAEDGPGSDDAGLVSLEGVSFRYPAATTDALREVSLDLRPGELVAIVGESGAGKTTLVDVLIGLLSPLGGAVRRRLAASVGYVAQETFVWDDAVRFNVTLGRPGATGDVEAEIWESLEAARLADWVRRLPDQLDASLGERGSRMSGGERQRLGLARALYGHPSILVLDEPTSALDGDTSRSLMSTLVSIKAEVGIIVVTHDPIVMEYGDRTITLGAEAGRTAG